MKQKKVVIYTGPNCKFCKTEKAFFDKHGIKYVEFDISKEPDAKLKLLSMGVRQIPYTLIDDLAIRGFDEGVFEEEFGITH